jgi:F0F1-type ATP synthase assembly protein I
MIVFIFAGVFGGIKLDKLLNTTPLFTTVLSLIGVVLAVFFAIKDLIRQPKDGDTVK